MVLNGAGPVGADEDETDCFSEVLDGSERGSRSEICFGPKVFSTF